MKNSRATKTVTSIKPNYLAQTVKSIAAGTDPVAKKILDRSTKIDLEFVRQLVNLSVFSWEGRRPSPALDTEGNFIGTDLDLLSFLVPLAQRKAVIEIPTYTNRRQIIRKEGVRRIGANNFGPMTGLVSNQKAFSFSARVFDQTIVVKNPKTEQESIGAWRNYMLVDCNGRWHEGWNKLVWDPTKAENAFLGNNLLLTGNEVSFKYFVHPNRRQSVFGAPYLLLKMLSARITDEAKFYRSEVQRLKKLGLRMPSKGRGFNPKTISVGATKKMKVETMEMVLDMPSFTGFYSSLPNTVASLVEASNRYKLLTYKLKPMVQFVVRADEAAYYLFGHQSGFIANWMGKLKWKSGYRTLKGRTKWNRIVFSKKMSLRYRIKNVTQHVSAE